MKSVGGGTMGNGDSVYVGVSCVPDEQTVCRSYIKAEAEGEAGPARISRPAWTGGKVF